jgi:anti-sigma factor RsiW
MSDCARLAPLVGSRPGEIPEPEAAELRAHLEGCPSCQALAADLAAMDGLVADGLARAAARRDFSAFADGVMARIPAGAWKGAPDAASPGHRPGRIRAFLGRHRVLATLAPALAGLALYLYIERSGAAEPGVEVSSETLAPMVLDTSDGPVILVGEVSDGT